MLVMIVLLCLPCSIKREFKQALNIPVAPIEHAQKTNKTAVCNTIATIEKQHHTVSSKQKRLPKLTPHLEFVLTPANLIQFNVFTFSESKSSSAVPIYILHEQYLI